MMVKANKNKIKRGGFVLSFFIFLLVLISCGINTYIYIYPPSYSGVSLSFTHNSKNNKEPNFLTLGYDIYYRIYDNSDNSQFYGLDSSAKENILKSDANLFFTTININKLISRNFDSNFLYKPIKHDSNDKGLSYSAPPILPLDNSESTNESFSINILLTQGNNANPYLETESPYSSTTLPETIWFRRYFQDGDNESYNKFENSDEDINFALTSNNVLVAFFVISYGFTIDYYTLTSEKPIYIGFTELIGE